MGNLEVVYELMNYTKVYIASEEIVNALFPLGLCLATIKTLRENANKPDFYIAKKIVKKSFRIQSQFLQCILFSQSFRRIFERYSTFSAIRTDKLQPLAKEINNLSNMLIKDITRYRKAIDISRNETEIFGKGKTGGYR